MALGRQGDRQAEMLVAWSEMLRFPGHVLYVRLPAELITAGFDGFVEEHSAPHMPRGAFARRCRQGATFGCCWSAPSRGWVTSAAWSEDGLSGECGADGGERSHALATSDDDAGGSGVDPGIPGDFFRPRHPPAQGCSTLCGTGRQAAITRDVVLLRRADAFSLRR